MNGTAKALLFSLSVLILLVGLLVWSNFAPSIPSNPSTPGDPAAQVPNADTEIVMYCAAGMTNPVAAIADAYENEYHASIQLQYGGSGTLLSNLRVADQGDLYLSADASYMDIAVEDGLVREVLEVAHLKPVIAVAPGNPKKILQLADLWREDVSIALGNPEAASIGKQTQLLAEAAGAWTTLKQATQERGVFKPTVNDIANDVKIGAVDAAIVWDATVAQYEGDIEAVSFAAAEDFGQTISLGVLACSAQPTAALRFARYLTARDRGLETFAAMGFPPIDGDVWALEPEIVYYSGGVNRVAIQEMLAAFEKREGVRISTVYNGCGILVGQIKGGAEPDVYHSCDLSFMRGIEDRFEDVYQVSQTDIVILAPKDNPHHIQTLADLTQEGLRVGVTNEEQSALGALVARLLRAEGLYDGVMKNVVTQTPTADMLVLHMREGALDAAIVYEANTTQTRGELLNIRMNVDSAKAVQTWTVNRNSGHKHLMKRFLSAIQDAEATARYEAVGFHWIDAGYHE